MTDRSFTAQFKNVYLAPTSENLIGHIVTETLRVLTGPDREEEVTISLPLQRDLAHTIIFETSPIQIQEILEIFEPQPISFYQNNSGAIDSAKGLN